MAASTLGRLRPAIKAAGSRLLVLSGAPALLRLGRRQDTLVLVYHNVVPDDAPPAGDLPLHLPRARFAAQLDVLARTCEPVALTDLLEPQPARQRKPRVAITFDDAYHGAVTIGGAELARRGIPATVFVCPHLLGRSFWWDAIQWPSGASWREEFRARALATFAGRDDLVREAAARQGFSVKEPPAYLRCASEEELRGTMATSPLALASHSWSHPNLAALSAAELHEELGRPLDWLRARFDRVEPLVAYPYGSFSSATVDAARAVGYRGGVTVSGGWIRGVPGDAFRIPRVSISRDVSMDAFVLLTAGLARA